LIKPQICGLIRRRRSVGLRHFAESSPSAPDRKPAGRCRFETRQHAAWAADRKRCKFAPFVGRGTERRIKRQICPLSLSMRRSPQISIPLLRHPPKSRFAGFSNAGQSSIPACSIGTHGLQEGQRAETRCPAMRGKARCAKHGGKSPGGPRGMRTWDYRRWRRAA